MVGRKTGDCQLHVHVCGFPLKGSPFRLTVAPGEPCAATTVCTNVRDVSASARPREISTLHLSSRDGLGQRCEYGGARLSATITPAGPRFGEILAVHDHEDGTYSVNFVAAISARYHVNVRLDGEPIRGSPFAVDVPMDDIPATAYASAYASSAAASSRRSMMGGSSASASTCRHAWLGGSSSSGSLGPYSSYADTSQMMPSPSPRGRRAASPLYGRER